MGMGMAVGAAPTRRAALRCCRQRCQMHGLTLLKSKMLRTGFGADVVQHYALAAE